MKQMLKTTSTQAQTSEYDEKGGSEWYLNRPKPPTPEAVEKAQFVDKTFQWISK
jgi:hypothetical protein